MLNFYTQRRRWQRCRCIVAAAALLLLLLFSMPYSALLVIAGHLSCSPLGCQAAANNALSLWPETSAAHCCCWFLRGGGLPKQGGRGDLDIDRP